ncbi:MAG TPA: hydrogenase maturation nickel metallochaperone HypA [Candidatus Limnocylindria bacterium]|jgi:hydrogenase nickel incorporation protein HypA/HybF|nr:hydrogenase maturation nickel metallochaperone HypA [Candidatus Limnocylindria bacterium]
MHELSVALSLLEGVDEEAARAGIERVRAVHVRVGALSGIACDALRFSWELASSDTVAEGSELRIEQVPLVVHCERCRSDQEPVPGTGLVCPRCHEAAPTIVHGRELHLVAMEVPA